MTTNELPVVLFRESLEAGPADVVDGNVDVVNAMFQEFLGEEEIAADALRSYYVDYYLNQSVAGGFAQYVFGAEDRHSVDELVRAGLDAIGATEHAAHFDQAIRLYEALSEDDAEAYLDGDSEDSAVSAEVQEIEAHDEKFDQVQEREDLLTLNAEFLRGHAQLILVDDDGLDEVIDQRLETVSDLEERRASALSEEDDDDLPGFEIIIRELCDVAEVELEDISHIDPEFSYEGQQRQAWHFRADGQQYLMVELEDEAHMLHPGSLEVVALVEIEDLDDDFEEFGFDPDEDSDDFEDEDEDDDFDAGADHQDPGFPATGAPDRN